MYGATHKITIRKRGIGKLDSGKRGEKIVQSKVVRGFFWGLDGREFPEADQLSQSIRAMIILPIKVDIDYSDQVVIAGVHPSSNGPWEVESVVTKQNLLECIIRKVE